MQTTKAPFGLTSATALVVANMIGAGVFTTSGFSFADLQNREYVMWAWVVGGVIATCGAVSYGLLAKRLTESGGEYLFLSRLLHPSIGFIAGWVSLLAGFTGAIAFAATAFETYAIPDEIRPDWLPNGAVACATIIMFGILHASILRSGLVAQNLVVAAKLLLLVGFLFYAAAVFPDRWHGWHSNTEPVDFSVFTFASTLVWISLSFSGFNAAVYVTGEVERPEINVPRGLVLGTLIVTGFYLALNFVFLYAAEPESIRGAPDVAAVAASVLGGKGLAWLVRAIVCLALLSSVSSMVIAGPRVYAKMADDGLFPHLFRMSRRGNIHVPARAIGLQVALAVVVVWVSTLRSLLDYLGFTLSVSAALTASCLFWSIGAGGSENESSGGNIVGPRGTRPRVWQWPCVGLYIVATLILAVLSAIARPQQLTGFGLTVISGLILYTLYRWWQKK